jgi:hypothetical protein
VYDGVGKAVPVSRQEETMSFLDKVTKAVGDVVDKGKKDVDQFLKIQKLNGEVSGFEKKIEGFTGQIDTATKQAGVKAIELLRAGAISSPELQAFVEQIVGIEQQIAAEQANIAAKKEEIERVKAEHEAEHAAAAPAAAPAPPAPVADAPVAPPPLPTPPAAPAPVPAPAVAVKFCPQCGAKLAGGAFCGECGAKLG